MYPNGESSPNDALIVRRNQRKMTWKDLVSRQISRGKLIGVTCPMYSQQMDESVDDRLQCRCGRLACRHSYSGEPITQFRNAQSWKREYAVAANVTTYGQLDNDARFLRCDIPDDTMDTFVQLIVADVGAKPKLLVSCYGGALYFTMTDELEREFMNGIGQMATTKDVWLLTTGLNSGVSKLIGQSVHRHTLLDESPSKPVVIGMSCWGTLPEEIRQTLKPQESFTKSPVINHTGKAFLDVNQTKTPDPYHTHFLLLDDGRLDHFLDDDPRSKFVKTTCDQTHCHAITIIVEGGVNTVEVIEHDLDAQRPVIIIHGSGRLASVLGNLLESAGKTGLISDEEIEQQLKLFPALYPTVERKQKQIIKNIGNILNVKYRPYFSVFQLGRDVSLTNTIFQAVFDTQTTDTTNSEQLLELAVRWNCIVGAHDLFKRIEMSNAASSVGTTRHTGRKYYPTLFETALRENRPSFVDYFLRRYYNPLETSAFIQYRDSKDTSAKQAESTKVTDDETICVAFALQFIVETLYKNTGKAPTDNCSLPQTLPELDQTYQMLIGPFVESFYTNKGTFQRIRQGFSLLCRNLKWSRGNITQVEADADILSEIVMNTQPSTLLDLIVRYTCQKAYGKQEMLRDIFLWSVYQGYVDIAFVLLLQLKSRISAALVATRVTGRLASMSHNPYMRNTYKEHQRAFAEYATACIDACYRHHKRYACRLLLREIPLFGNITCMQLAIATRSIPFINTNCFNQVLDQEWYGHLDSTSSGSVGTTVKFLFHVVSFGIFAPTFLEYRSSVDRKQKKKQGNDTTDQTNVQHQDETLNRDFVGIEHHFNKEAGYIHKWIQFHTSPIVMVTYHLCIYIWFLLVFSYLMLFRMKSPSESIHWSEIYVIITVTATLLEDIRKVIVEFHTRMLERWNESDLWTLNIHLTPYILFYLGIALRFGSKTHPDLLSAARVVLALDLGVWYLFSLRFLSTVKLIGPKLFMIRNMMRDLFSVMFIILLCNAAYGVVTRALTMHSSIEFTFNSILTMIFYRPYWFLYGVVEDEKNYLDGILTSDKSVANEKTAATVHYLLLIIHMLFLSILMLNLLIAMFKYKNTYFWRYQRYELIREYFEKPMFAYPPLSLFIYVWLLIKFLLRRRPYFQIFKRRATPQLDAQWTDFEHEATYEYARTLVEEKYRSHRTNETILPQPQSDDEQSSHVQTRMQETIDELQAQNKQMLTHMERMMEAINSMKTSA